MNPIRKIVAAIDLSEASGQVLAAAREMATKLGASVEVVHVVYDLSKYMGFYIGGGSVRDLQASLEREADAKIHQVAKAAFGETEYQLSLIKGTPYADLVQHLAETDADLLVVGAHGLSKPEHKVFGSVAERLVKNAPCPILVVGQDRLKAKAEAMPKQLT